MKISISLRDEDVSFLDDYAQVHGMPSRSATVQRAIRLLRTSELAVYYAAAFEEWSTSGESRIWDEVAADSLVPGS